MPSTAPRTRIEFSAEHLSADRRREVATAAADLVRAAARHDEFAELWMADALSTAMADPSTAVLVLAELSDLVCTLAATVAHGDGRDRDEVIARVASSWVEASS